MTIPRGALGERSDVSTLSMPINTSVRVPPGALIERAPSHENHAYDSHILMRNEGIDSDLFMSELSRSLGRRILYGESKDRTISVSPRQEQPISQTKNDEKQVRVTQTKKSADAHVENMPLPPTNSQYDSKAQLFGGVAGAGLMTAVYLFTVHNVFSSGVSGIFLGGALGVVIGVGIARAYIFVTEVPETTKNELSA